MLVFLSIFWTFSMIWNHNVLISFCFDSERRKVCWFTQQLSTLMLTLSFPVINEKSNSRKYFASFVNSENSETRLKIYNTWMLIYLGIVTHWTEKKKLWLETSADATIRIKSGKWNQTSWWVKSETDNKSAIIQVRIYFDFIQKLFWKTSVFLFITWK